MEIYGSDVIGKRRARGPTLPVPCVLRHLLLRLASRIRDARKPQPKTAAVLDEKFCPGASGDEIFTFMSFIRKVRLADQAIRANLPSSVYSPGHGFGPAFHSSSPAVNIGHEPPMGCSLAQLMLVAIPRDERGANLSLLLSSPVAGMDRDAIDRERRRLPVLRPTPPLMACGAFAMGCSVACPLTP